MTDKEMAKQFADDINGFEPTCSLLSAKDKSHAYRLGRYDGFLAGLEAGKNMNVSTNSAFNDPQSKHLMIQTALEAGAEIGKREICNMGLALQSDMDKTIEQNQELKKILDDYRDFIAEKKLQEEFKRFLKEVEK